MERLFLTCVALCGLTAGATAAAVPVIAESASEAGAAASVFSFEGGLRYWPSTGKASKDLYDHKGTSLVSRLTYDDLDAHSSEVFFNAIHNPTGIFVKGLLGAGGITEGFLIDEDFLRREGYSNTFSDQRGGGVTYFTADLGYNFLNSPRSRIGAFVGYNFLHESYDAFGCTQQATNWRICVRTVPTNVGVISQDNDWHSLRLGLAGQTQLTERFSLSGDVALLLTRLDGEDQHHMRRSERGPKPEDGDGRGVQFEAVLNYKVTDLLNIGVGARYWGVATDGTSHFEIAKLDGRGRTQVTNWETERYGVFVQASIKFN